MKTAVEFLIDEIIKLTGVNIQMDEPIIEQAKEMEKSQHEKTWTEGMFCETGDKQAFEQYYNETFKK
jgi:hypothetical protein